MSATSKLVVIVLQSPVRFAVIWRHPVLHGVSLVLLVRWVLHHNVCLIRGISETLIVNVSKHVKHWDVGQIDHGNAHVQRGETDRLHHAACNDGTERVGWNGKQIDYLVS